jgi:hypothetical protein
MVINDCVSLLPRRALLMGPVRCCCTPPRTVLLQCIVVSSMPQEPPVDLHRQACAHLQEKMLDTMEVRTRSRTICTRNSESNASWTLPFAVSPAALSSQAHQRVTLMSLKSSQMPAIDGIDHDCTSDTVTSATGFQQP